MAGKYDKILGAYREDDAANVPQQDPIDVGAEINAADAATPADADFFPFSVSSVLKKITWANLKIAIKAIVDAFSYNKTVAVPAGSFLSSITDGATYQQDESTTHKRNRGVMVFSATTPQYIDFAIPNDGRFVTNKFRFKVRAKRYTFISGTDVDTDWKAQGLITNPEDLIDTAFGTAVKVDLDLTLDTKAYQSAWSETITMGGSAMSADSYISIKLYRDTAGDAMNALAGLLDVTFEFNL